VISFILALRESNVGGFPQGKSLLKRNSHSPVAMGVKEPCHPRVGNFEE
jgi:hypothetical protein